MSDNHKQHLLLNDSPIEKQENDLYNRNQFSEIIGDALLSTPLGESLCVALMGPWGSGKTSIINLVKNYISSKQDELDPRTSIILFEPWNFTTSEQLLTQFFFQLAEFFGVDKKEKDSIGHGR